MSTLTSGFEGAMSKRRLIAWKATEQNINGLVSAGGATLRARARQIVRSNPYAANAANSFVSNAINDGIRPSCLIEDKALKDEIIQLWKDWVLEADADGLTDFYGMQALIAHALFEAGECFIRFRPRWASDGLSVPLQLQLLESELLPLSKTELATTGNTMRARKGKRGGFTKAKTNKGLTTVPMFVLIPQVSLKKRLDVKSAVAKWSNNLEPLVIENWKEPSDT